MPLSGWLISRTTWRIQFLPVIVLVVAGLLAVAVLMRNDRPPSRVRTTLALTRPRVAMLAVVGLFSFAAESLFVVYGAWLEADLGFDVGAIGAFTVLVVAAELTGEGGVAALGDRIGLHRAVRAALVVSTVAYLTLLTVGNSVPLAILAVVIWFVGYEVSIVASVPLVTELGGEGRDRLLGLMVGVLAGGRAVGALVAPQLFALGGIGAMAVVSAVSVAIAAVLMATLVPVPRRWVG
ncbi:MAG: MFS transporter [Actinomycetota bacterium]